MTGLREPEALVRALSEERVPAESPEVLAARRDLVVSVVARKVREARLQQERRQRVRRLFAGGAVAAAAVLAVGLSLRSYHAHGAEAARTTAVGARVAAVREVHGTLVVTHAGRARVLSQSDLPELTAGDELQTATDGRALLQTERSAIRVAPATQLSVMPLSAMEERIHLALGKVELKVAKRPNLNRSVVVETPNAEVVVHGTMFSVVVDSEQEQPVTHVRVTEGSVWILHDGVRELIALGEEWASNRPHGLGTAQSQGGPDVARPVAESAPSAAVAEPAVATPARRGMAAPAPSVRVPAGTLGEDNKMFAAAVDARNHGDEARALELFGSLLARHPSGQLAEESRVERMRALRRTGNASGAAAEARRYLAEHPHGYAQDEARAVALGGK